MNNTTSTVQNNNGLQMKTDVLSVLGKFFGLMFLVLLPIRPAIIAVSCLVLADFITGVWASVKEKKKITSTRLRRTIIKGMAYQSAIIIAFILETYLLDGMPVVKVITGLVGVTEGKSFFENLRRITGIDFWNQIISKVNMSDFKNQPEDKNTPKQ